MIKKIFYKKNRNLDNSDLVIGCDVYSRRPYVNLTLEEVTPYLVPRPGSCIARCPPSKLCPASPSLKGRK